MLRGRGLRSFDLDRLPSDSSLLSRFDVDDIASESLLFQTGYLTIREVRQWGVRQDYRLGFPNREVRKSLNDFLLDTMAPARSRRAAPALRLEERLAEGDFEGVERHFRALYAAIPWEWHTRNDIARSSAPSYYASVFYSHIAAAGLDVAVEDRSSHGRVDLTVRLPGRVVLFEFKVVEDAPEGSAIAQLRARGYADKHRDAGLPITLVGVEFSRETRNIASFEVEAA